MNTNNEIDYFNSLLTSLEVDLDNKLKDIDCIEEKYRKLKEEELGDLMSQKEKLDKKIEGLKALIACYEDNGTSETENTEPSDSESKPKITPRKKTVETHKSPELQQPKEEEKEPEITDTLFPENNTESENETESEDVSPTEEPQTVDTESETVETQENDGFSFGDEEDTKGNDDNNPNEEWPDLPEEWN